MRVPPNRIVRELFFWLRPDFMLRCVRRFQALEGFDRAIALASSTFTATIPLTILVGAILPSTDAADSIIRRYGLDDEGAQAVRDAFAPAQGTEAGLGVFSALLLLFAVLSFARAVQRLIERAYELKPLSLRNTRNAALWIGGLVLFGLVEGLVAYVFEGNLLNLFGVGLNVLIGIAFLLWTGRLLSANRVADRDLLPFAILVGFGLTIYGVVSDIWVPRLFDSYAERYGVIGATFAIISAMFGAMFVVVVLTAIAREVADEIERVRRGERPPEDAVQQEWELLLGDLRARRDVWLESRRARKEHVAEEDAAAQDETPP
jgi:membrane protein